MNLDKVTEPPPSRRAVEAIGPIVQAVETSAPQGEQLDGAILTALCQSGLTEVFRPEVVGGQDIDLPDYLQAIERLARADASTAWCLQIYNVTNWLVCGLFDDHVLTTLFGAGKTGVLTGSMAPNGPCSALEIEGGYQVTGRWRFVSGCDHADWIFLKAPLSGKVLPGEVLPGEVRPGEVRPGEALPREHILALAPRADCLLEENWQYAGLQATGSKGVGVEALDIAPGFAVPFDDHLLERGVPPERGRSLPLFRLPSRVVMRLPITAVALGVAKRALELFEQNINEVRPNGFSPCGLPNFQRRFAESALEIDQAEGLLYRTAAEAEARARANEDFPPPLRARYGRDLVQAVHLCAGAVDRLMAVSGARQMFTDSPMQVAFRDIHAITCHHSCDRDRAMTNYARVRLGLDLKGEEV